MSATLADRNTPCWSIPWCKSLGRRMYRITHPSLVLLRRWRGLTDCKHQALASESHGGLDPI